MAFNVFHKLAGTLLSTFRIGVNGPSIRQGSADPIAESIEGVSGDLYIKHGLEPGVFQMSNQGWIQLAAQSSASLNRQSISTATFTASNSNYYLGVNRDGSVDITLPAGVTDKQFIIKDEGGFVSYSKPITIYPAFGETIEGQASLVLTTARSSITIVFGSEWHVI